MPLKRIKIPLPVQGVSQQPDEIRTPSQVSAQEEGWSSVVEGLVKRQPTHYINKLAAFQYRNALVHPIERDSREEYLAVLGHQGIVVADTLGNKPPIIDLTNGLLNQELLEGGFDWAKGDGGLTFEHNIGEDPEGLLRAARVGGVSTIGNFIFDDVSDAVITTGEHVFRFQYKNDDCLDDVVLRVSSTTPAINAWIRLTAASAVFQEKSSDVIKHSSINLGNGWWEIRLTVNLTTGVGNTITCAIYMDLSGAPGGPSIGGHIFVFKPLLHRLGNSATFPYLDLEDPNQQINDASGFITGWTRGVNTPFAAPTTIVGPHGYGVWSRLQTDTNGAGDKGTYSQDETSSGTINAFFDGPQVYSVYFKKEGTLNDASSVQIGFIDDAAGPATYLATFNFDSKVLELGNVDGQFIDFGVVDLGGDVYQAFVVFDPSVVSGTAAGVPRGITIIVNDSDAGAPRTVLAWGADLQDGFRKPRAYVEPRKQISAVTIADTTYVSNSNKVPDMGTQLSTASLDKEEAFIFVRQGSFNTFYRVNIQHNDGAYDSVELLTTSGTGSSAGTLSDAPIETWAFEITALGNVGSNWIVTIAGLAGVATVVDAGDDLDTLADKMLAQVQALIIANPILQVTVTRFGRQMRVSHRLANVGFTFTVINNVPSGTAEIIPVLDSGTPADRFGTLSTDAIASELATQLNALTNLTARSVGSVIQILTENSKVIDRLEVEDGNGDQNMIRMWKEVPFLDELPLECRDGFKLKVVGNTEREADDFYVVFSADTTGEFGSGVWRESLAGNIPFAFDRETMPHVLTRKQDDDAGTITGVKLAIYFEWDQIDWQDRLVGDSKTNPRPSLITQPIRRLFLWKNRLGFLAGQNTILSEAGQFISINLWRTTVRNLIDSDLIDISAGNTRVSKLNHVAAYEEDLLVLSDRTIYILQGSPLTPKTAALAPTLEYRNSRTAGPRPMGRTVMMASDSGKFSELKELFRVTDTAFDATDITQVISKYIEGRVQAMSVSTDRNLLVAVSDGNRDKLYIYKFFWDGNQKVQSSWSRWSFGEGQVLGAEFLSDKLYILVEREDGLFMERMEVGDGLTDTGLPYVVRLDQRLENRSGHVSEAFVTNTEITVPYDLESKRYDVVDLAGVLLGEAGVGYRNKLNFTEQPDPVPSESYWTKTGSGTITPNTSEVLDPFGTNRATKVDDQDAAANFRFERTIPITDLVAGKTYSYTIYVKQGGTLGPACAVDMIHSGGVTNQEVLINFNDRDEASGIASFNDGTFDSKDAGGGWFRVRVSLPWDGVNPILLRFRSAMAANSVTGHTYCAFPQFEEGGKATEYEPMRGNRNVGSNVIKIPGNHTAVNYFVGAAYKFQAELSKPIVRVQGKTGGLDFVAEGRVQARRVLVEYADTSRLVGVVDKPNRIQSRDVLDTSGVLKDGNLSVAVAGEGRLATVTIENDSHLPSAITGAEWFVQHRPRGART